MPSRATNAPTPSRATTTAPTPTRTGPRADASPVIDLAARRAVAALALEDVRKAWADLVSEAKAQSLGKAAHLNDAEPISIDGGTIVIGFATDFARAFWQDRLRAELERGLSERLSVAVRVRCVVQPLPAGSPDAQDDPMHRAALEIFRRSDRIMEIE